MPINLAAKGTGDGHGFDGSIATPTVPEDPALAIHVRVDADGKMHGELAGRRVPHTTSGAGIDPSVCNEKWTFVAKRVH
jgi:hypothetical protein